MTAPADRSCPSWCKQPADHLFVEPTGPGDYHISEFTVIDLPQIPGLRDTTAIQVAVEQYVTATTIHQPMIAIGLGPDGADNEALTPDEVDALTAALTRAVTQVRTVQTHPNRTNHDPI
ncbi:hypothetical protein [Parafrankia sp. BMG5.11]|uniref:DUF6907 domain-containing protein n=1 Tax=Parafrankia sp. BMG5.11 TaxID=222540 RepID=UPI00103DC784|nr:hypothetical protein [Parafrankia sp. BMG5.11]TCJ34627.1 hypothetical protein E0504_32030 [Parafrankia sp. BMG5.11]